MRWKRFVLAFVLMLSLVMTGTLPASAGDMETESVTAPFAEDTVLVKFTHGSNAQAQEALLRAHGLSRDGSIYGTDVLILRGKGLQVERVIAALQKSPLVEYAEPDYIMEALWTPNDPALPNQWALHRIEAPQAWDVTRGSSKVLLAVVDSGVDLRHRDLASKIRTDLGWNFVHNNNHPQDDNGHGTAMAGVMAAATDNGFGMAGLCPECMIIPVKVMNAQGSGTLSAVASGIIYAADKGAHVINLSLGAPSGSATLLNAVQYAYYNKGAILSCAAGNSGGATPMYPAAYPECIAVAATDGNDNVSTFSPAGVETAAPGVSIYTTALNNSFMTISGTSLGAAHVSGLAGLLVSQGRPQNDIRNRLSDPTYTDPVNNHPTLRRINAYKAVAL